MFVTCMLPITLVLLQLAKESDRYTDDAVTLLLLVLPRLVSKLYDESGLCFLELPGHHTLHSTLDPPGLNAQPSAVI